MIRILFVCHGNICRSPMAECMMKKKAKELGLEQDFYIESAATSSEEVWGGIGNPVYPPAREILRRHGIDCSGKRARVMKAEDIDSFDILIGMDRSNIRDMQRIAGGKGREKIFLMMSFAGEDRPVADPWYTGDFETSYADIDRGIEGLLDRLRNDGRI